MHDSYLSDKLARADQDNEDEVTLIEKYISSNGVTFEIRAIDENGEVLAKSTTSESAYSVSLQAHNIDEEIYQLARQAEISRAEYLASDE